MMLVPVSNSPFGDVFKKVSCFLVVWGIPLAEEPTVVCRLFSSWSLLPVSFRLSRSPVFRFLLHCPWFESWVWGAVSVLDVEFSFPFSLSFLSILCFFVLVLDQVPVRVLILFSLLFELFSDFLRFYFWYMLSTFENTHC